MSDNDEEKACIPNSMVTLSFTNRDVERLKQPALGYFPLRVRTLMKML